MEYKAIEATNTKTRRLAYVQALITILKTGNFSEAQLLERIVRWSNENADSLRNYWVSTGEITSTRKNSAGTRYVDLAVNLGVIASISGVYRYTRLGLVLLTLLEQTEERPSNAFELPLVSRLFFTYLLLQRDADLLLIIGEYMFRTEKPSLAQMQREFKDLVIERLNLKIALSTDERTRRAMIDRRREIENWKKPERYAEHLVPPRLNWLLDLKWLDTTLFMQHSYMFTPLGYDFVQHVPVLRNDSRDADTGWFENDFWKAIPMFADSRQGRTWSSLSLNEQMSLSEKYLKIAFRKFRNTSVPRISLGPTLVYTCLSLAATSIATTPNEFLEWIRLNQYIGNARYEIRQSPRENEAYIVVRMG